ncbi:MAG: hypothetical protein LBQ83_05520 [Candidatus Margulisbacteria bacterium]|nr:hypothetical protein [Candidatus Margulisiibacteriota bacterium]
MDNLPAPAKAALGTFAAPLWWLLTLTSCTAAQETNKTPESISTTLSSLDIEMRKKLFMLENISDYLDRPLGSISKEKANSLTELITFSKNNAIYRYDDTESIMFFINSILNFNIAIAIEARNMPIELQQETLCVPEGGPDSVSYNEYILNNASTIVFTNDVILNKPANPVWQFIKPFIDVDQNTGQFNTLTAKQYFTWTPAQKLLADPHSLFVNAVCVPPADGFYDFQTASLLVRGAAHAELASLVSAGSISRIYEDNLLLSERYAYLRQLDFCNKRLDYEKNKPEFDQWSAKLIEQITLLQESLISTLNHLNEQLGITDLNNYFVFGKKFDNDLARQYVVTNYAELLKKYISISTIHTAIQ